MNALGLFSGIDVGNHTRVDSINYTPIFQHEAGWL